jgi:molybdopterin/thiamine biosynthesis adenylyltransferase
MISDGDLERYSRQILLPEIDLHGQQRIDQATVAVVGCGGLGSMVALMLAGAGVGRLTLIDDDVVEVSNLHRQLAFRESDLGVEKVVALRDQLLGLNSGIEIHATPVRFGDNASQDALATREADIVVDATDSLTARHAIERITRAESTPWIMGAATRLHGQLAAFSGDRREGCYLCMAPSSDDASGFDCRNEGILGPVVTVVAAWQAQHALLFLAGHDLEWGQLNVYDAVRYRIDHLQVASPGGCHHS